MSVRHTLPVREALLAPALAAMLTASPANAANTADWEEDPDPIIVEGERDEDYLDESRNNRLTEPLRDTPRSVTVVPRQVIDDSGAQTFREIVRTQPGVTLGTGEGGNAFGDRIFIRGFDARNDVYIDGMRDPGVTSRELFAVEQIEIIRGPSSSFGGRGTTGGAVSLQSRRPRLETFAGTELSVGTENMYRAAIDVNRQIGETVAIRLNGLYHQADTPGRDHVEQERYGIAPALLWQPLPELQLRADYYHFRLEGVPDFGQPFDVVTQQPYKVDRDNFYGAIGRDFLENGADIATLEVNWRPSDSVSLRSTSRYGETFNRYVVTAPSQVCRFVRLDNGNCPAASTGPAPVPEDQYTVSGGSPRRWADNRYFAQIVEGTFRFDTGGIGHTLVAGGEYAHEGVDNHRIALPSFIEDDSGTIIDVGGSFPVNLLNPNPVLGFDIPHHLDGNPPTTVRIESLGAYLIDTIRFSDQLRALVGIRFDDYSIRFRNPNATGTQPATLANDSRFLNYQASLIYKPVPQATLYASFSTSSNPSGEQVDGGSASYDGIAVQTQDLDPERNKAWELGAKYELAGGAFLISAAAFRIDKENAREQISPGVFDTVGVLRSEGLEVSVAGNPTPRLSLFGGYTYVDARVVESVNPALIGGRFPNIPKHSLSMLATYKLSDRLTVGGQAYYQDEIHGGSSVAGTSTVPGYWRFDAVARYRIHPNAKLRLNVLNLTDKIYYDAIYRSGSPFAYIAPGRSAHLTLELNF